MAKPIPTSFCKILSESSNIVRNHRRHFLTLSALFLLPISFSTAILQSLLPTITPHNQPFQILFYYLLYLFIIHILSLCATGTITYSVYNGFFSRPVTFISSIKSLSNSLIHLIATTISTQFIIFSIISILGLVLFFIFKGVGLLGFEISFSSPNREIIILVCCLVLGLGLLYVLMNWSLAYVIVVMESSWGFTSLKRSKYLIKGMRWISLSISLYFGLISLLAIKIGNLGYGPSGVSNWILYVIGIFGVSITLMASMLQNLAAITVLYIHCKASHGEEVDEEIYRDYVSLPYDEEKVDLPVVSAIPTLKKYEF